MRTTVNIDDALLERAKALAYARQQPIREIISEGLRVVLFQSGKKQENKKVQLVTFCGNGTCPVVDLDSNSSVLDAMEAR
jgi:hypothetical protein